MKFDDFFKSKFLKSSDLDDEDMILTIKKVEAEQFEGDLKPVVWFEETKKGLVLNRTNFRSIVQLHGQSTDTWVGKRIALFEVEVSFRSTPIMAIRIRLRVPQLLEEEAVPF